jgi:hypothetical protein
MVKSFKSRCCAHHSTWIWRSGAPRSGLAARAGVRFGAARLARDRSDQGMALSDHSLGRCGLLATGSFLWAALWRLFAAGRH